MSFTSFVVLFHSFVCTHVCGLSGHFPFLFVVPLAYSFIAISLIPHLIIYPKTIFASYFYLMTLLCDFTFILWPPFFPCMSGHFPSHYTPQNISTVHQLQLHYHHTSLQLFLCMHINQGHCQKQSEYNIIVQCTQMVIMTFPLQSFAYFKGSMIPWLFYQPHFVHATILSEPVSCALHS